MDRRTALKLLGVIAAFFVGRTVVRAEQDQTSVGTGVTIAKDLDLHISEDYIENIIIDCKDGTELIIPFSDIIEALKA